MSAMAEYDLWLREHGLADSADSRAKYMAERASPHRAHSATECSGGQEAHDAHMEINGECPWDAKPPGPVVIAASSYAETEKRLMADRIIVDMVDGVRATPRDQLAHPDGGPRHQFMMAANDEYRKRGGTDGGHMGAIANAILALLDEPPVTP